MTENFITSSRNEQEVLKAREAGAGCADSAPALLEAVGIGRRLRAGNGWLFRGIDIAVSAGERMALVGSTGAGKSVLLRALAQLDVLDEGEIRRQGEIVGVDEITTFRSEVIYLHQRPALTDGDVEAQLRLPFSLKVHHGKRFDRPRVEQFLRELGREASFLSKSVETLSGGEAQLTALLRAIQLDPTVLLLDEPTASLDPTSVQSIEALVGRWQAEQSARRSYIWVTHDLEQAQRISTRTLRMDAGSHPFQHLRRIS